MKLITQEIERQLLENGRRRHAGEGDPDVKPVVKLFTPDAQCTWLISEMDPEEPDILFGLCDLGMGFPELGNVSLSELQALRGGLGLPVERDLCWTAKKSLIDYAEEAREAGRIKA